jgi:hypothetical protein
MSGHYLVANYKPMVVLIRFDAPKLLSFRDHHHFFLVHELGHNFRLAHAASFFAEKGKVSLFLLLSFSIVLSSLNRHFFFFFCFQQGCRVW